ncbi:hypothetical protein SAMN04488058_101326 [Deinococcus reticulitermitis]|uniref:Uncharacterized protein n=1 Tax=Deinococcus reticulitermitis TaxID=856736 RepID=A0A1H6SJP3_9DEIO|nr:hypothetical protein [Deinococcus reticulitermitis]SEI68093.1 hypothetical protein SAMN04488058_101326 [Deinococcus reticulitermitis]
MIAIQPRSAKHLVLSRLSGAAQSTPAVLSRVQSQQLAAVQTVVMSEALLIRHLKALRSAGYVACPEDGLWRLTDLGETALDGLGIWRPRRTGRVEIVPLVRAAS